MCNMLHEMQESADRLCGTIDMYYTNEIKEINELSVLIRDLYLNKHHNDELMDLGGKYVWYRWQEELYRLFFS